MWTPVGSPYRPSGGPDDIGADVAPRCEALRAGLARVGSQARRRDTRPSQEHFNKLVRLFDETVTRLNESKLRAESMAAGTETARPRRAPTHAKLGGLRSKKDTERITVRGAGSDRWGCSATLIAVAA